MPTTPHATAPAESSHWSHIARRWSQVGPPLRPSREDLGFYAQAIAGARRGTQPLRALILGVTPELWRLPWPAGASVLAADRSEAMIAALWPGPPGSAIRAEWTDLPLPDASRDCLLCDGGLHLLKHPEGQARLVESLARVLAPGGIAALRLFVPPAAREAAREVLGDLLERRIADLNVLKMRLAMALQHEPGRGVGLYHVWESLHAAAPDLDALADRLGWSREHIHAIDTYQGCPDTYHFIDLDTVRGLFTIAPGGFALESVFTPSYPLAERCPTILLRRR